MIYLRTLIKKKAKEPIYCFTSTKKKLFSRTCKIKAWKCQFKNDCFQLSGLLESTLTANKDSKYLAVIPENAEYYEGVDENGNDVLASTILKGLQSFR